VGHRLCRAAGTAEEPPGSQRSLVWEGRAAAAAGPVWGGRGDATPLLAPSHRWVCKPASCRDVRVRIYPSSPPAPLFAEGGSRRWSRPWSSAVWFRLLFEELSA